MDFNLGWMAWTWQTAAFFGAIAASLLLMTLWEFARPGGGPRHGVLGLDTTRGDRLFISLLAAAYIHLGWLAFAPDTLPLWYASIASAVLALGVFLFV
jgi:predicted small integral membrane protein